MPTTTTPSLQKSVTGGAKDAGDKQTRKHSPILAVVQVVAALILVPIALEFLFAVSGIGEEEYLRIDPVSGFAPMEGKHVTWRREGFSRSSYNSLGMHDKERTMAKPDGAIRIAFLGDSYVEALQVPPEHNFCARLEKQLNQAFPGKQIEVLNFGVSNYNLGQMLIRLKEKALPFKPDLVILSYRVDDTIKVPPNPDGGFFSARPFVYIDGGKLKLNYEVQKFWTNSPEGKRMRATEWLRRNSRTWGVIGGTVENCVAWWQGLGRMQLNSFAWWTSPTSNLTGAPKSKPEEYKPHKYHYSDPENLYKFTKFAWPLCDGIIKEMASQCAANDCQFLILRLPFKGFYENPVEKGLLKTSAASVGAQFIDTGEFVRRNWDKPRSYELFTDQHHLSSKGHQVVAGRVFEALRDNRLFSTESKQY